MDLASIQHKGTTEITIYDPFDEPTDIVVELYGRDTKEYRQAVMDLSRESKVDQNDKDESDRRGARVLLAAVKSWQNVVNQGEEISPDSTEAVDLLARDDMDWFAGQLHRAINNRSLFFERHASN